MGIDVSVLIPAYRCGDTLNRAIISALNQADITVQVCVCDDGNNDNTASVIKGFGDMVTPLYHETNRGQSHALNTCGEAALGRYFVELDSDDYVEENALAALVSTLDNAPPHVGFAYGCTQYHGELDYYYQPRPFKRADFYSNFPSLYPFLYRREAWDAGCRYTPHAEVNGRSLSIQDWDMALQLIEYMRYDGLALRDTLVLHYSYQAEGTVGGELKANGAALMAAFKQRWPKVIAEGL